jgi:parallel beta-helix repeat protein
MSRKLVLATFFIAVLIGTLGLSFVVQRVEASGTVYIRADGSIDPSTAPISTVDNVTYTFTDNINSYADGIVVERNNVVVDGAAFRLQGAGAGIGFTLNANNVTVRNTVIAGFDIAGSGFAAAIYSLNTFNNIIVNNTITGNKWGVDLEWVSGYVISGNSIISQSQSGIHMRESRNNVICENDINENKNGITLADSSNNNKFYDSNFVDNVSPGFAVGSDSNVWDDGYPSGGNYWSDYTGADLIQGSGQNLTGSDGIGDTPHSLGSLGTDNYPLMGLSSSLEAGTWDDTTYHIQTVSNSTVSDFIFNLDEKSISFNITGSAPTMGFCRIAIPDALLGGPYTVSVGTTPVTPSIVSNGTHSVLYFTYNHSTKNVRVNGTTAIPEFPPTIILPLFMVFTMLAVVFLQRKVLRKQKIAGNVA